MNVRAVVDGIIGWTLLLAPPAAAVVGVWWLVRNRTGWDIADFIVSLVVIGWCYWLTRRQQRFLDFQEAQERRNEENDRWRGIIANHLRIDVHTEDIDPDWAEQDDEPADDDTQQFPAITPDTEPMQVIPARVDDVPLARVAAEIEADRGEPGSYVDDVELAWIIAKLQDRIEGWRRDREAVA